DFFGVLRGARGALEGLGGGMQIAGAVIDDGNRHRDPPGSGNKPMMPPWGIGGGFGWPGTLRVGGGPPRSTEYGSSKTRLRAAHRSKTRRSALSSSSATTTSSMRHLRRDSVQRRRLAASKPSSSASTRLMARMVRDPTPNQDSGAVTASSSTIQPISASHSRC